MLLTGSIFAVCGEFLSVIIQKELSELFLLDKTVIESLYRSSFLRYIFILFLAMFMVKFYRQQKKHRLDYIFVAVCGIFSLAATLNLYLGTGKAIIPVCPDFGWSSHHWYYYMFAAFLLVLPCVCRIRKSSVLFQWLGRNSWYIFLIQMFAFCVSAMLAKAYLFKIR